jgi:hypothetical protein
MGSGNVSKIERVSSSNNHLIWVDLCLDKKDGAFFAVVGGQRIEDKTKEGAVAKVVAALDRVTAVAWREIILIRVSEFGKADDADSVAVTENDMPVFGASCRFVYLRRERAANPHRPKETVQREHSEDFERRVASARKSEFRYGYDKAEKKRRADEVEQELRDKRAALGDIRSVWEQEESVTEYEIPYSAEVWAGIQRIAQTLRDTQATLNAFVTQATPERFAALAVGDVLRQIGPGSDAWKGQ